MFVAFWEKNVRFPQRGFGREKSKGGNWVFRLLGIFWMWSQPESATGRSKSFAPKIKSVRFIHWDHRWWKRGNILSANTSFNLRNGQGLFHQFWTGIGYAVLSFVTTWGQFDFVLSYLEQLSCFWHSKISRAWIWPRPSTAINIWHNCCFFHLCHWREVSIDDQSSWAGREWMGLVMALNVTGNAFRVTSNTIDRASAKRG